MDYGQIKQLFQRLGRLMVGFLIMAFALVFQFQARLGYGAWTVFDHGLTQHLPITIGTASILSAAGVVLVGVLAGEKIGVGMPLNMVTVGLMMDAILALNIIPTMPGLNGPDGSFSLAAALPSLAMLLVGIVLLGFGACIYMSAGLGAGPRDTLMVVMMRWTGKDIAFCKGTLELGALFVGYLLGGSVGVGTLLVAVLGGPAMQFFGRLLNFDPKAIKPITMDMLPGVVRGHIRIDALSRT